MKFTLSDKIIAYMTLLSGLIISAVAIWYSVAGLVSIFAAAALPIIIMGVALEGSKLIATVWLKWNWNRAPLAIKAYLLSAIAVLMLITSMGIFGYLSKAHLDQAVPTGDVVAKVELFDQKIKTQQDNIEVARRALAQMDAQVDQVLGRTEDARGAERAVQIRRNQARERAALQADIAKAQAEIAVLNEQRSPVAAELRAVEAKVGPIKYIAALLYGDRADDTLLEDAVRWVIIIIVLVFDPLAVILLLASQYSFQWFRQAKEQEEESNQQDVTEFFQRGKLVARGLDADEEARLADEANAKIAEIPKEINIDDTLASIPEPVVEQPITADSEKTVEGVSVEQWNKMIAEAEKAVTEERELDDHEIIEEAHETEKEAMRLWKEQHPEGSLKHQRKLLERGVISELPWQTYLKAAPDFTEDDAATEAAKWALEQIEKKKDLTYVDKEGKDQIVKSVSYEQNAEQNSNTLWARIKNKKDTDE